MNTVLEGGTDAASMLVFDPAALPNDYDVRINDDPMAVILELADAGRLYWLDTQCDGGYRLGICLGGILDHPYVEFAKQAGAAECLEVPSGELYFTGIEYAFHQDDSRLRKHPHMGSSYEIPRGTYQLALYEMEYPGDFHRDLLRRNVSAWEYMLYSLMNVLVPLGCAGSFVLVISPFLLGLRVWLATVLPISLALIAPAFVLTWLPPYREMRRRHLAFQKDNPEYIAVLSPVILK